MHEEVESHYVLVVKEEEGALPREKAAAEGRPHLLVVLLVVVLAEELRPGISLRDLCEATNSLLRFHFDNGRQLGRLVDRRQFGPLLFVVVGDGEVSVNVVKTSGHDAGVRVDKAEAVAQLVHDGPQARREASSPSVSGGKLS